MEIAYSGVYLNCKSSLECFQVDGTAERSRCSVVKDNSTQRRLHQGTEAPAHFLSDHHIWSLSWFLAESLKSVGLSERKECLETRKGAPLTLPN